VTEAGLLRKGLGLLVSQISCLVRFAAPRSRPRRSVQSLHAHSSPVRRLGEMVNAERGTADLVNGAGQRPVTVLWTGIGRGQEVG
jgi:hypothetical protein